MPFSTRNFAAVSALVALAQAHGVMDSPKPYGMGSGLTNGPMTQAGFPCKKNEVQFSGTQATAWSGGQQLPLKLLSGATHGGGTCFLAMTYEKPGSAGFNDAANWRNIKTLPGDCPATTPGNLETATTTDGYPTGVQCTQADSDQANCVHSYNIAMPDALKDGDATLGWVWLSKVTAETYMNCAPVTVSGSKNGGFDSLPSLTGLSFTGTSGGGAPGGASAGGSSSGGSSSGSSSSGKGSPAASSPAAGTAPAAPASPASPASPAPASSSSGAGKGGKGGKGKGGSGSAPASSAAPSNPGGAFAETSNGGSSAPAAAAAPAAPAAPASGSGSGSACSPDGSMKCTSSSWSICNQGSWVDMGGVGGLTCTNGNSFGKRTPYKTFQA